MLNRARSSLAMGAAALIGILYAPTVMAQGAPSSDEPKRIILVVSEGQEGQFGELKEVIREHTEDLGAEVEIVGVEQGSSTILERIANIRALLLSNPAFFAIWIERSTSEVFLFVSNRDSDRVFLHTFPIAQSGWAAECDTIAALVRSALITWLDTPSGSDERSNETGVETAVQEQAPQRDTGEFVFYGDAGYSFGLIHPETTVHGVDVALAAVLWRFLELRISARFFQSEPLGIEGESLAFHRLPFLISIAARWPIARHELGLRAGLVLDATHLSGDAASDSEDETDLVHPGFSPSVFYRLSIWRFLYLWMEVGPELYFHRYYYTWNGETVLDYGAVQGRASVGLSFAVDLGD